ncbi:MAG: hypothetical protein R3C12_19035 [Planctomycetaceae bacterium]|nr:hypothetical protein [Planctomycetaceae bacterium]
MVTEQAMTPDKTPAEPQIAAPLQHAPERRGWRRVGFYALNVGILFHLVAVCAAPLSVQPSSPFEQTLWLWMSPYVQVLYQNNGFHFFAPNPEGTNSVVYKLEFADGTTQDGKFPHRQIFPRLMYHRHFMLSEFLGALEGEEREKMTRAFARRLCEKYGAAKVEMSLQWHDLALRERILAGGTLFDQDLYQLTPLGTYTWDELSATSAEKSSLTSAE